MKIIETIYDGHRFRSRLEARWAVFFKKLGIEYEYEKEGFDLDGDWYLPDFWLPKQQRWIEIKGEEPNERESELAHKLAEYSGYPVYIYFGQIDIPDTLSFGAFLYLADGWDHGHIWCECTKCGELGIQYAGRAERLQCGCFEYEKNGKVYAGWTKNLVSAYGSAKQARFEHGMERNS